MEIIKTHSKLGIASCLLGTFLFLIFLLGIALYNLEFTFGYSLGTGELVNDLRFLNISYLMFVPIPAHSIVLIIGFISLFFPNRKKLFPILGVILNLIFGLCGLFPYLAIAYWSLGRVK
ncbi:MAG TPA: hypothetical protein PKY82_26030 [Pyrinomonadaceae bacterium]|nr:hypothetical protein [Pyrinomonadaceae bacterium]